MTLSIATDARNDLFLDADGLLSMARGVDAVRFAAEQAARAQRGEMVLAQDEGLPYFLAVWVGSPNMAAFEAALRARLLAVPDVTGIVSLTTSRVGDVLAYVATIRTVYGQVTLNG